MTPHHPCFGRGPGSVCSDLLVVREVGLQLKSGLHHTATRTNDRVPVGKQGLGGVSFSGEGHHSPSHGSQASVVED